jgi:signal peptidase I
MSIISALEKCCREKSFNGAGLGKIREDLAAIGGSIYPGRQWVDGVETFLLVIIVALGIRTFFIQTFSIPTNSMAPSYYGMTAVEGSKNPPSLQSRFIHGLTHYAPVTPQGGRLFIPINDRETAIQRRSLIAYDSVVKRKFFILSVQCHRYTLFVNDEAITVDVPAEFDLESTLMSQIFPEISSKKIADVLREFPLARRHGRLLLDTQKDVAPHSPVMTFNLQHGDVLLVDRLSRHFRRPHRGGAIVFATRKVPSLQGDDRYYIKRLVGIPGDSLAVHNWQLWRDGMLANDSPAMANNNDHRAPFMGYFPYGNLENGTVSVPEGHFFVMGDNSAHSYDSRFFGPIPQSAVIGRPLWVFFPKRDGR